LAIALDFLNLCDDPFTVYLGPIPGKHTPESEMNRIFKNEKHEYLQNQKKRYRIFFMVFFFVAGMR